MKYLSIIGIFIFLSAMTCTALANPIDLSLTNYPNYDLHQNGASPKVTISGSDATFQLFMEQNRVINNAGFIEIGLPKGTSVQDVQGKYGGSFLNSCTITTGQTMGIWTDMVKVTLPDSPNGYCYYVKVICSNSLDPNAAYVACVKWSPSVAGQVDAAGDPLTNAYFGIAAPSTSVPEFPSVVLPVAAILAIVVIFGFRKNVV